MTDEVSDCECELLIVELTPEPSNDIPAVSEAVKSWLLLRVVDSEVEDVIPTE